jgi:hypothetical protein
MGSRVEEVTRRMGLMHVGETFNIVPMEAPRPGARGSLRAPFLAPKTDSEPVSAEQMEISRLRSESAAPRFK